MRKASSLYIVNGFVVALFAGYAICSLHLHQLKWQELLNAFMRMS